MKHADGRRTTIPIHPGRDIPKQTLHWILNDINITTEDLRLLVQEWACDTMRLLPSNILSSEVQLLARWKSKKKPEDIGSPFWGVSPVVKKSAYHLKWVYDVHDQASMVYCQHPSYCTKPTVGPEGNWRTTSEVQLPKPVVLKLNFLRDENQKRVSTGDRGGCMEQAPRLSGNYRVCQKHCRLPGY